MTDYIVANCETAAFNGTYEYDDGTYGLTDPLNDSYAWILWDGNGHTVPDNIIAVLLSDWTVGQPYIADFDNTAYYCNQDEDATPPTAPDDPSIVWMINNSQSGVYSNLTVTAAGGGAQNLTLSCAAGSYLLAGVACTLTYTPAAQNLTLSCGAGSLALTGSACTLSVKRNFVLSCSAGSYAVTGTSASLTKSLVMACESGGAYPNMVVSGAGATEYNGTYAVYGTQGGKPLYRKNTPEVVGGYAYIVYNETYKYWFISPIDSDTGNLHLATAIYYSTNDVDTPDLVTTWQKLHGSLPVPTVVAITYSLTGSDVTLTYTPATDDYTLACESGSYALTGTNADLLAQYHYSLACNSGSYVLTGLEADLFKGLVMPCGNGSYILTGSPATINSARTFALGMGSYVLTGMDAYFIAGETTAPACRTYVIKPENRLYVIPAENRVYEIKCC